MAKHYFINICPCNGDLLPYGTKLLPFWLLISKVLGYSHQGNSTWNIQDINHWNVLQIFKIKFPTIPVRALWVKFVHDRPCAEPDTSSEFFYIEDSLLTIHHRYHWIITTILITDIDIWRYLPVAITTCLSWHLSCISLSITTFRWFILNKIVCIYLRWSVYMIRSNWGTIFFKPFNTINAKCGLNQLACVLLEMCKRSL